MARTARQYQADLERGTLRDALRNIRLQLARLAAEKKVRVREARETCRAHRQALKVQRAEAIAEFARKRVEAREECRTRHQGIIDAAASKVEAQKARRARAVELNKLERAEHKRRRSMHKGPGGGRKARETRAEQEDEAISEIERLDPALMPVWHRVKGSLRATDKMTLAEAFLEYLHDNPEQTQADVSDYGEARAAELIHEAERIQRVLSRLPHGRDGWKQLEKRQSTWAKTAKGASPVEQAAGTLERYGAHLSAADRREALEAIRSALAEANQPADQMTRRRLAKLEDELRGGDDQAAAVPF